MNRHLFSLFCGGVALTLATVPLLAKDIGKVPRGEPIQPITPRGEPIQAGAPTAAKPSASAAVTEPAAPASADFAAVGFDKLSSFKYEVPDDTVKSAPGVDPDQQIPALVRGFNNKRVSLKGFMLPLKVEAGMVTEMLILRDQSACCFGATPKINEWVSVKMVGGGVKPIMDQAVTLYGTLRVGAMRENGYIVGIYQLDGEKMQGPPGT
jgi:hypothetical protein